MPAADGVQTWRNLRNKFCVFRLHYIADPRKRSETWSLEARAGMPQRGWRREYEIDWTSPEGDPVIPEYSASIHVRELDARPGVRLLRGWDFGFVTPAVVFAQLDASGRLLVLAECVPFNTPLDALIEMVHATTIELVGKRTPVFDAGDPAADATTDLGSVQQTMRRHGIMLHTHRAGTDASYQSLRQRFLDRVLVPGEGHQPRILVHPRCRHLNEALAGAFHLSTHAPYKPIKQHPYKDIADALRYLHDNLQTVTGEYTQQLRTMATRDCVW